MNLVWTNWIATSLTKAGSRAVHMNVIEAVVGQRDYQNLGVAVMPCHSYMGVQMDCGGGIPAGFGQRRCQP